MRLTCRPGPLQGGLPLPVDLAISPLDVPCSLMEDRGRTPGERKTQGHLFSTHKVKFKFQSEGFNTDAQQLTRDHFRPNHLSLQQNKESVRQENLLSCDLACEALSCS